MSRLENGIFIIEAQEPEKCELCGNEAECRPYGPNGENVCFPCGMKDEASAYRALKKRLGIQEN